MQTNNYLLELEAHLEKLFLIGAGQEEITKFVKDKVMESFKNSAKAGRRDRSGRGKNAADSSK